MDAFAGLPTLTAGALNEKAKVFAKDLAERLETFNSEFPLPEMEKEFGEAVPEPNPEHFIAVFENVFCRYMAGRNIIVTGS